MRLIIEARIEGGGDAEDGAATLAVLGVPLISVQ